MADEGAIAERVGLVLRRIRDAEAEAQRPPGAVRLVAVSKRQPAAAIEAAYAAGLRCFGENYVQELVQKAHALEHLQDIEWHHIGHLQRNKIKQLAGHVSLLHGVDRSSLIAALGKFAAQRAQHTAVLLQVNLAAEASKTGCALDEVESLLDAIDAQPWLKLRGFMAIPPAVDDPRESRAYFHKLRSLREQLGGAPRLPELSMGMSADYAEAIAEGATLVRVGRALFGERP